MVDVDDVGRLLHLRAAFAEPREGGAVEREDVVAQRCSAGLHRLEARQVVEEPRERLGNDRPDPVPHRRQRVGEAQRRAEAVGVGVLVREARDLIGAVDDPADRIDDVLETRPYHGCGDAHSGTSTAASPGGSATRSLRSVLTRTL